MYNTCTYSLWAPHMPPLIIQHITDAALYYAVEVYKKVETCSSKDGKFIATVQLCIILNNMQAIKDKLSPPDLPPSEPKPVGIIDELGLQEFFEWLEQEKGIGLKLKEFTSRTMHNTASDIFNKIHLVALKVREQVTENIYICATLSYSSSSSFQPFNNSWEISCRHVVGLHLLRYAFSPICSLVIHEPHRTCNHWSCT